MNDHDYDVPRAEQPAQPRIIHSTPLQTTTRPQSQAGRIAATWYTQRLQPWLRRRGTELEAAADQGWSGATWWIRALTVILTGTLVLLIGSWICRAELALLRHAIGAHGHTGLAAVVTVSVRTYLLQHTAALPVTASTAFTVWQLAGLGLGIAAAAGSTAARLGWTGYGAATAWMVWAAAPAPARPIAAGLTVLAWALASLVALNGLTILPHVSVFTSIHHADKPLPHVTTDLD